MQVSAAILLLIVAPAAHADWNAISAQTEPSPVRGLEHRYVILENSVTGERVSLELALFSVKSCKLRVIDQPTEPRADLEEVMIREKCLAGVNGGYFDPDYRAIGLLTVDGKTIAPLQSARLLTGVFSAVPGKVQILRVGEFARQQKADAAVECGPMIIDLGKAVHGLESTRRRAGRLPPSPLASAPHWDFVRTLLWPISLLFSRSHSQAISRFNARSISMAAPPARSGSSAETAARSRFPRKRTCAIS